LHIKYWTNNSCFAFAASSLPRNYCHHPTITSHGRGIPGTFLIWKGILESILGIALVTSDLLMTMLGLSASL
jgi:hypothetical protein